MRYLAMRNFEGDWRLTRLKLEESVTDEESERTRAESDTENESK